MLRKPGISRHSGLDPESPEPLDKGLGIPGQARDDDWSLVFLT